MPFLTTDLAHTADINPLDMSCLCLVHHPAVSRAAQPAVVNVISPANHFGTITLCLAAKAGRAIGAGSVGPDVAQVETWLNGRSCLYCTEGYVTENRCFGPEETAAVRLAQQRAGLLVTGTVDRGTWAALQAQSCPHCSKEE